MVCRASLVDSWSWALLALAPALILAPALAPERVVRVAMVTTGNRVIGRKNVLNRDVVVS